MNPSNSQVLLTRSGTSSLVSASGAEDPDSNPAWDGDFSGPSHISDFKIGTPVAILPGAWHYRVIAGTGRPGDSLL